MEGMTETTNLKEIRSLYLSVSTKIKRTHIVTVSDNQELPKLTPQMIQKRSAELQKVRTKQALFVRNEGQRNQAIDDSFKADDDYRTFSSENNENMYEENITTISTESHFKGWPIQLWEAIISNIDAKTLLKYDICQGNAYNVRSFSSIIGETFFL